MNFIYSNTEYCTSLSNQNNVKRHVTQCYIYFLLRIVTPVLFEPSAQVSVHTRQVCLLLNYSLLKQR